MSLILKWALIAAVVVWGVWYWRRTQAGTAQSDAVEQRSANQKTQVTMQPTLACTHCGVHAAKAEMLRGKLGVYCCIQHCQAHGDQPAS